MHIIGWKRLYFEAFYQLSVVISGSDDPDNLGHLGHFLAGQVGIIHKSNYPDVTRIIRDPVSLKYGFWWLCI